MVIVLNGVLQDECPLTTNSLYMQHPIYRDYAQQLLSIPTKSVGPVGLLYVGQREMAAAAPHDKNINIVGSDDATTCIIVVVRHSGKTNSQIQAKAKVSYCLLRPAIIIINKAKELAGLLCPSHVCFVS